MAKTKRKPTPAPLPEPNSDHDPFANWYERTDPSLTLDRLERMNRVARANPNFGWVTGMFKMTALGRVAWRTQTNDIRDGGESDQTD